MRDRERLHADRRLVVVDVDGFRELRNGLVVLSGENQASPQQKAGLAACGGAGVPQAGQERSKAVPQEMQNRAPAGFSAAQLVQTRALAMQRS